MFYRRIAVAEYGVVPRDIWVVWLGGKDNLPPVGAQCHITYRFAGLPGSTIEAVDRLHDQAVLDGFDCSPGALPYKGLVPIGSGHGRKD